MSRGLSQGNFIARVQAFTANNLPYTFRISRSSSGSANPLTTPEIQLGTIAQDLQRRDRISDRNTADNFAFTLDGNSSFNIAVQELGSQKGDVNIHVVQDLNSNGVVDQNASSPTRSPAKFESHPLGVLAPALLCPNDTFILT